MKNKIILTCVLVTFTFGMMACTASFSTNTTSTSNAAKPSNAPANTASNSNSASNTATAAKTEKKGEKIENEKKPEGKSTKAKDVPVPADWVYMYNEQRGYGFSLPAGSTGHEENTDGTDIYIADTPAPSEISVLVFAFKNAKLSKEDLLNMAEKVLVELGNTVQAGKLTNESEDYSVAEASMTTKAGVKNKVKVLVGTDVTDNYVMIVGTEESKFAANQKIIDEIWGSFEMWSGGSSGNN